MSKKHEYTTWQPYRTTVNIKVPSEHPLHQMADLLNKLELRDSTNNIFMHLTAMSACNISLMNYIYSTGDTP